jgi:hypothetical protein
MRVRVGAGAVYTDPLIVSRDIEDRKTTISKSIDIKYIKKGKKKIHWIDFKKKN